MLLPNLAALAGEGCVEAAGSAAHFQNDGLPSDAHFAALAAAPADAVRTTRRHALLLALRHASAGDLARREGGAAAVFAALAALSPGDALDAHLRALVGAVSTEVPALVFLSEIFGPHSADSRAAAAQVRLKSRAVDEMQKMMLTSYERRWLVTHQQDYGCKPATSLTGRVRVSDSRAVCSRQVRALKLVQAGHAALALSHPAANRAPASQLTLPRLLAATCSPLRAVRLAALDALPELAGALQSNGAQGALAAAHLSALAAAVSEQRAALVSDAGALPAALRLSLQRAQRAAHGSGAPADNR